MRHSGLLTLLVLVALFCAALYGARLDLSGLASVEQRAGAWDRVGSLFSAFAHPDLSGALLTRCRDLALETAATATLATALACVLGTLLALLASRNVLVGDRRGAARWIGVALCEGARLVQDVLRGVPDFVWAVVLVGVVGLGAPAGVLAIGLNVAGILARVLSELFDAVPARALEPLRQVGASRAQTFLYGIVPAIGQDALSFVLLRWECAIRNATVIGAVGGGGLGAEVRDVLAYGYYDRVPLLLASLLLLTAGSDLLSQILRARLRHDPDHPRHRASGGLSVARQRAGLAVAMAVIVGLVGASAWHLRAPFVQIEVGTGLGAAWDIFRDLLHPDPRLFGRALASSVLPACLALAATLAAAGVALVLAFPASWTFQRLAPAFGGSRGSPGLRLAALATTRLCAIVARAIPEVFWALLFVSIFKLGTLPALLALAIHTFGLLLRLFVESIDALPLRRLEPVHAIAKSRVKTWLYAALPGVLPQGAAHTFFQLEANLRASVVLGMVGAAEGLGFVLDSEFQNFRMTRASTYLVVMIAWAFALDRLSRLLGVSRARSS